MQFSWEDIFINVQPIAIMSEKFHMKAFPSHSFGKREGSEKMYLSTFNYHCDRKFIDVDFVWDCFVLFIVLGKFIFLGKPDHFYSIDSFSFTFLELN